MGKEFSYWIPVYGSGNSFIYLLFATILMLSAICFIYSKYDILYPPLIGTTSFLCCIGLAAFFTDFWSLPMHFNTAFTIICMVFLFIIGGFIATQVVAKIRLKNDESDDDNKILQEAIGVPLKVWFPLILLLSFCLYENYTEFINLASLVTSSHHFSTMLFPITTGIAQGKIRFSNKFFYILLIAKSISYTSILFFWYNLIEKKYKNCLQWGILVFFYFPFILLTGGRQLFLYFILYSLISLILVLRKKALIQKGKQEVTIVFGAFSGFLLFFLGTGLLSGKINAELGFFRVLGHYAGVNISAFDVYLNEMMIPDTPYIGLMTLSPINAIINHLGFNLPIDTAYIPFFTVFGDISTNVYTALMRYIADYGMLGCGIIMFLLGYGYTLFYEYILFKRYKSWMIMLYAFIAYPIFLLGREERFFNEILATRTVYTFIIMIFFYKFALKLSANRKD